jgi:NADH-quinone oxidoreductase subunit L
MIFRAFYNDPCPEAVELEGGHPHHAPHPFNPATGEREDTDVGFPGPAHPIAERAAPMRIAMSLLALGAILAGLLQIPQVDSVVTNFLRPAFATAAGYEPHTRNGVLIAGLVGGTLLGLAGIALAWRIWGVDPELARRARERMRPLYSLLASKWYFDELIAVLFVEPAAALGRLAANRFEPAVIEGAMVGGASGLVRVGSAAVRAVQSGFVRYYAATLVLSLAAVGLYFLLQS